jgi:hypothetical protein
MEVRGHDDSAFDTSDSIIVTDELETCGNTTAPALEDSPQPGQPATAQQPQSPQASTSAAPDFDEASPTDRLVQELMEPLPGFSQEDLIRNDRRIKMLNTAPPEGLMMRTLNPYASSKSIFLGPNWFENDRRNEEWKSCQRCNPIQEVPKNCIWDAKESPHREELDCTNLEAFSFPSSRDLPSFAPYYERPPNLHIVEVRNAITTDISICVATKGHIFHLQPEFTGTLDKPSTQSRVLSMLQQLMIQAKMHITPLQLALYTRTREGQFQYHPMSSPLIYQYTYLAGVQCHKFIVMAVITHWQRWTGPHYADYCIRSNLGRPLAHHVLPSVYNQGSFTIGTATPRRPIPNKLYKKSKTRRELFFDYEDYSPPPRVWKPRNAATAAQLRLVGMRSSPQPRPRRGHIESGVYHPVLVEEQVLPPGEDHIEAPFSSLAITNAENSPTDTDN